MVLPADVRTRHGIETGTRLVLVETDGGLVPLTREQLRDRVRRELSGTHLVEALLDGRRAAADSEDVVA